MDIRNYVVHGTSFIMRSALRDMVSERDVGTSKRFTRSSVEHYNTYRDHIPEFDGRFDGHVFRETVAIFTTHKLRSGK